MARERRIEPKVSCAHLSFEHGPISPSIAEDLKNSTKFLGSET